MRLSTLLSVAAVLAALSCCIGNCLRDERRKHDLAKISGTRAVLRRLETACEVYEREFDRCPPQDALVQALTTPGPRGIAYLDRARTNGRDFLDCFGRPIQYGPGVHNAGRIDLYSFGPDGVDDDGENDDISNWK